ncbi:7-carboxy-7-deazaguanine synthase QueE [Candidatus Endobugula sertula]|uniref:7-carboxy-7-deazaguanine synthase n=1 Tax=Candidatus Endobugula sertula TaxID=62101 RepID=A0A1D2QLY7_9GAMM|nr:7-carboxy-7-deazaguanine synthase QueE [Candidatus Endobugula sertula]
MTKNSYSLKVTEIFLSIQGEAQTIGRPTVFIRLTGCPLRCHYCDSEYAFFGGERMTIEDIVLKVATYGVQYVCVTGGEPLAQANVKVLLTSLCNQQYNVSLETSGAMPISGIDPRVSIVMDLKTPASGEVEKNDYSNCALLKPADQVKFVICDRQDYEWALFKLNEYQLVDKVAEVLFSPSYGQMKSTDLVDWILEDRLPVRFQMQLHKALWGDKPGS